MLADIYRWENWYGKRTFEAAKAYRNNKVAVHNFASASNPGGGVIHGATAQKECLCRCSYLYFCLNTPDMWDGFYTPHRQAGNTLHNDDIIYTPDVTVFKSDTDKPVLLPENEWYKVNVITCAAPNLRAKPSNKNNTGDGSKAAILSDNEMLEIHEKRLRRILDVAVYGGNDNESAKFWLSIMNGLKNRGVEDILIACVDGLNGFPQAIEAVYPKTEIQ